MFHGAADLLAALVLAAIAIYLLISLASWLLFDPPFQKKKDGQ